MGRSAASWPPCWARDENGAHAALGADVEVHALCWDGSVNVVMCDHDHWELGPLRHRWILSLPWGRMVLSFLAGW